MAGVACARTLVQAGHRVTRVRARGRAPAAAWRANPRPSAASTAAPSTSPCATRASPAPSRPPTAAAALERQPRARARRRTAAWPRPPCPRLEPHWVAQPGMDALVAHWAAPLGDALVTGTRVTAHRTRCARCASAGSCAPRAPTTRSTSIRASTPCCWRCRPARARALLGRQRGDGDAARDDRGGAHRALLDLDDRLPAGQPADAVAPGPAVERGAQHPPSRGLAGARVVQARPRAHRALDPAGQRRPGRRSTCATMPRASRPSCCAPSAEITGIRADAFACAGPLLARSADPGAARRSRTCGTPRRAWAWPATGAPGIASKMPSCRA